MVVCQLIFEPEGPSPWFVHRLIECEVNVPTAFAAVCAKPYGKLFYNRKNPDSFDCNHAVLLNPVAAPHQALEDLILFYHLRGLTPRVFPSYREGEQEQLFPALTRRGFVIQRLEGKIFVRQNPSRLNQGPELEVLRIRTMDPAISRIFCIEDGGNWNVTVLKRQLETENLHLLAGYADGKPVCLCVLRAMHCFSRLDDVITHPWYRERGYGRALIQAVLNYHDRLYHRSENLYLWASNPTAIRIYQEAGFVALNNVPERWHAWLSRKPSR